MSEESRLIVEKHWSTWHQTSSSSSSSSSLSVCPLTVRVDSGFRAGILAHYGADEILINEYDWVNGDEDNNDECCYG